ncbi:MAG: hypothetical protein HYV28_10080 [Ignavibacteriales bacterium]|nr:hypothetical protein [Ignavibacteriales bacterium]
MTTFKKISLIFAAIILFSFSESQAAYGGFGVSFNYFYSRLTPYGDWIELDRGVTVWRPVNVSPRWSPYMRGSWIWTDCGWYWDSYENYGDIVYHYGRWYNDEYYGWIWVPDYQWSPAWVEWRYDNDYIGWAPLPPYAVFGNGGIHFSINFNINYHHFHFVKYRHFGSSDIHSYYEPDRYKYRIYNNTRVRNEYGYERDRVVNRGIDRATIEQRGKVKVRERQISFREDENRADNMTRVGGDRIEISVPRERGTTVTRDMNIKRADRSSSMNTERVTIGRPERAPVDTKTNTERNTTPAVRDDGTRTRNTEAADAERKREAVKVESERKVNTQRQAQPKTERETRVVEPRREAAPRTEVKPQPRIETRTESRPAVTRERTNTSTQGRTETRTSTREEKKETPSRNRQR